MKKKLVFALLLFAMPLVAATASVLGVPENSVTPPIQMDLCTSPPPDSFRITGLGPGFVTVAWNPVSPGDNHLLSVFVKNALNEWDTLYNVQIDTTTSYTATEIDHSKAHKLEIRTICSNGDPGLATPPVYPPHGLILDLVLGGRTPKDPQQINDCLHPISYVDNDWIGFQLSKTVGNSYNSSLFEFVRIENGVNQTQIKRVCTNASLVAANEENSWPTFINSSFSTKNYEFKIGEVIQGIFYGFGIANVILDTEAKTVSICPDQAIPSPYSFQFLLAKSGFQENLCPPPTGPGNQVFAINNSALGPIRVQNPASEFLNLFFAESNFESGVYDLVLTDINGRVHFDERLDISEPNIAIPIYNITSGIYFLCLEFKGYRQNLKVIVSK